MWYLTSEFPCRYLDYTTNEYLAWCLPRTRPYNLQLKQGNRRRARHPTRLKKPRKNCSIIGNRYIQGGYIASNPQSPITKTTKRSQEMHVMIAERMARANEKDKRSLGLFNRLREKRGSSVRFGCVMRRLSCWHDVTDFRALGPKTYKPV